MSDRLQNEWNRLVRESRKDPARPPEEPPPQSEGARRNWALPALFVLSLAALVLHFTGVLLPWPAKPTPEELEAGQQDSLEIVAQAIHDYAAFHGQYPERIDQVMSLPLEVEYRHTADGFELSLPGKGGKPIVLKGK